jgi:hypothetical protein
MMGAAGFRGGFRGVAPGFHGGFRSVPVAPFGFHSGFGFHGVPVAPFGFAHFPNSGFVFVGSFGHNPRFHAFVGSTCFNCGFVHRGFFPAYAGYAYPAYYPPVDYSQPAYASQPPVIVQTAPSSGYGDNQLVEEVQGLRDEVRQLREEQSSTRQNPQAGRAQGGATAEGPTTVLVFRDGHRTEVRNYAIAGTTLWVFNERQAKKILISELDIPATEAANTERGVEFSIPQ